MYYNCFRSPPALSTGTLGFLFYLHCLVATFAQESNAGLQFRYTRRKTVGLVSAVCQRVRHHLWFMLSFLQGFWYFARLRRELQNSGKSAKSRKIHENARNTRKFARNNIKYISVWHIWNLSRLLGLFTTCKTCKFILKLCLRNKQTMFQNLQVLMMQKTGH